MKITSFDRAGCKQFQDALAAHLAALAAETGLTVTAPRATFDPTTNQFTVKIEASGRDSARLTFERLGSGVGFKAEDFGKSFLAGRVSYVLKGVTPNGCVLAYAVGGNPDRVLRFKARATDGIVKQFHPDHQSWDEKIAAYSKQGGRP